MRAIGWRSESRDGPAASTAARSCTCRLAVRSQLLMRRGRPTHMPLRARLGSPSVKAVRWPLIGREAALGQLIGLVEEGTGVAILGPAGVGKSRLLHEVADRVRSAGMDVVSVVASVSTSTIPFAPFAELLPGGPTPDELAMLGAARGALEARAGPKGVFLAIDDAHHLDPISLSFLISVVASGIAVVGLTARTGEPMSPDLVDLWTNGVIRRIDLQPLDRDTVRRVVEDVLGPASEELHDGLWRLSEGNLLVLHEVLEGAVGSSIQRDESGMWVEQGSLVASARLADLVASRLAALPGDLAASMDFVALGSPLPLDLVRRAVGDDLAILEERGLVDVSDGLPKMVTPAHPLHGEILEAQIGGTRSRAAYSRLANAAAEATADVDALRLAIWQKESGDMRDLEVALAGATEALTRHDPGLAAELLEGLDPSDDRVAVLLGRSLSYRQRFAEAEAVLAGRSPGDPALLMQLISIRGQNLGFGLGRIAEAQNVFAEGVEQLEDPELRARLNNERALMSGLTGDFADVEIAGALVLDDPATSVVSRATAHVGLTIAYGMTANCDAIEACSGEALTAARQAARALPLAEGQIIIMRALALLSSGRPKDGLDLLEGYLSPDSPPHAMMATFLSTKALLLLEMGRLASGLRMVLRSQELYEIADPFRLESQAKGLISLARGQMGDRGADAELTEEDLAQVEPRIGVWVARGRAWAEAARGDLGTAVVIAGQAGRDAVVGQHTAWGALSLHDTVRFGSLDYVDDLLAIDSSRGARRIQALQRHARALRESDLDPLREAAGELETMGADLLAAEAYAQLAARLIDTDRVSAARACVRSKLLEGRCEEASTPALGLRPDLVTDRELQVASDAATGATSPQIAEKLFISVRTVDNHLRSVYRKLGVAGRNELGEVIAGGAS